MLSEICRRHDYWIKIALDLCGDPDQAADLVQDMYLKLHAVDKEVNDSYIRRTITSIYIDGKRKRRELPYDFNLTDQGTEGSVEKIDFYVQINESMLEIEVVDEQELVSQEIDAISAKEVFDSMPWEHQVTVRETYVVGMRKFSRLSGISIATVQRINKNFKIKTWEQKQKNDLQGLETLSHTLRQLWERNLVRNVPEGKIF